MLKNYWRIILRNGRNNKLFTFVNTLGLGIGIASMVWGFQNYRFSFSYDNFHPNRQSVFRVLTRASGSDNLKAVCPMPIAQFAKNDFPAVKEAVRWNSRGVDIKAGQGDVFVTRAHFTDRSFFDCFNFPLIRGTLNLADRSTVLITEKTAKKYFGNTNPVGKTLLFYSNESFKKPLRVSGVLKDPPANSSLQFEIITHFDNLLNPDGALIKNDDWGLFTDAIFLKLLQPQMASKLGEDMKKYLPLEHSVRPDVQLRAFLLEPLSQVANHSRLALENNALDGYKPGCRTGLGAADISRPDTALCLLKFCQHLHRAKQPQIERNRYSQSNGQQLCSNSVAATRGMCLYCIAGHRVIGRH